MLAYLLAGAASTTLAVSILALTGIAGFAFIINPAYSLATFLLTGQDPIKKIKEGLGAIKKIFITTVALFAASLSVLLLTNAIFSIALTTIFTLSTAALTTTYVGIKLKNLFSENRESSIKDEIEKLIEEQRLNAQNPNTPNKRTSTQIIEAINSKIKEFIENDNVKLKDVTELLNYIVCKYFRTIEESELELFDLNLDILKNTCDAIIKRINSGQDFKEKDEVFTSKYRVGERNTNLNYLQSSLLHIQQNILEYPQSNYIEKFVDVMPKLIIIANYSNTDLINKNYIKTFEYIIKHTEAREICEENKLLHVNLIIHLHNKQASPISLTDFNALKDPIWEITFIRACKQAIIAENFDRIESHSTGQQSPHPLSTFLIDYLIELDDGLISRIDKLPMICSIKDDIGKKYTISPDLNIKIESFIADTCKVLGSGYYPQSSQQHTAHPCHPPNSTAVNQRAVPCSPPR